MRTRMNRRDFMKHAAAGLAWLALPYVPVPDEPEEQPEYRALPSSLGRIATWWRQAVRTKPSPEAESIAWKTRDEVIPLYAAIVGKEPWPRNPVWYQTEEGFIHSGYVQPVEHAPSSQVTTRVTEPGFWAQVCVPIAEARSQPDSAYVRNKLYYGTVYRVIDAATDDAKEWWYRLQDGVAYAPGPYVPAWSVRCILPEEMTPISPGRSDKRIEINIKKQRLTCFEGDKVVFSTRVSSGTGGTPTPLGEHRVLYKRHTRRMTGGSGDGYYDLPGVSFPVYFTHTAVAIHGTYWHNDFVRPHSHGCVNVSNQAAQWIFRWTDPVVPYDEYERKSKPDQGTPVVVI
jgi:hypothetical protein